jgi:hypothetical protein
VVVLGIAYLCFALVMTMAGRFPELGQLLPAWLYDAFNPNDKSNLAPYRLIHFLILALLIVRLVPHDWPGLKWHVFRPAIRCGQQSLWVFCFGILLAFGAHFVLVEVLPALWMQVLVSTTGIALMTGLAWYRSWCGTFDQARAKAPPNSEQRFARAPRS